MEIVITVQFAVICPFLCPVFVATMYTPRHLAKTPWPAWSLTAHKSVSCI